MLVAKRQCRNMDNKKKVLPSTIPQRCVHPPHTHTNTHVVHIVIVIYIFIRSY